MEQQVLTRNDLYDMVWSEPMTALSKKYNVSDTGLRKICKRLNIPLPKLGHWQRIQYGKKIIRQPLPEDTKVDQSVTLTLLDENTKAVVGEISPFKLLQMEIEKDLKSLLKVPDRLVNPDKLVVVTKDQRQRKWSDRDRSAQTLDMVVTEETAARAFRFWDTLIKALRTRGHDVKVKNDHTYAVIQEQEIRIYIREKNKREIVKGNRWDSATYRPTGNLYFQLYRHYPEKKWEDGKLLIEDQLSKIIAYLELEGEKEKQQKIRWAIEEAERKEKERIQKELENRRAEELNDFKEMLRASKRWHKASNLRDYIDEVEARALAKGSIDEELKNWLEWARKKADWYDPFTESNDELLDGIDRDKLEAPVKKNFYG